MKGKFIVIEGTDGSGKGTHTELLAEWLLNNGHTIEVFDFPQYTKPSAYFVERYLNGSYGKLEDIGAQKASLFYALDRYDASFKIKDALERGITVISNRYVASNMGHQGAKIHDAERRHDYYEWNTKLEYDILQIPAPDLNIVLHMPSAQAQKFVDQKKQREHLNGKKRDIHEDDLKYLESAELAYLELCRTYTSLFKLIECAESDGSIRPIETIQKDIRTLAERILSQL